MRRRVSRSAKGKGRGVLVSQGESFGVFLSSSSGSGALSRSGGWSFGSGSARLVGASSRKGSGAVAASGVGRIHTKSEVSSMAALVFFSLVVPSLLSSRGNAPPRRPCHPATEKLQSAGAVLLPPLAGMLLGTGHGFAVAYPTLLLARRANAAAPPPLRDPTSPLRQAHASSSSPHQELTRQVLEANVGALLVVLLERSAALPPNSDAAVAGALTLACLIAAALPAPRAPADAVADARIDPADKTYRVQKKEMLRLRKSWDARLQWSQRRRDQAGRSKQLGNGEVA